MYNSQIVYEFGQRLVVIPILNNGVPSKIYIISVYNSTYYFVKGLSTSRGRNQVRFPPLLIMDAVMICPPFSRAILSAASGFSPTETHRLFSHPGAIY